MEEGSSQACPEIMKAWTVQLYYEYDHIIFERRLSRVLRRPTIAVSSGGPLGSWSRLTRRITISEELIRGYAWDVVLGVLKHEIAHQLADAMSGHGKPHGDLFKTACDRLGVPSWARAATGELPTHPGYSSSRAMSEEDERVLKRVEKLFALAGSTNEHEAQLAMERAQEIMTQHNLGAYEARLKQGAHGGRPEMISKVINLGRSKMWTYEDLIISILTSHFFVYVVITQEYSAQRLKMLRALDIMGTPENVAMAEYVFHFLQRVTESLWVDHRRVHPDAHRTSFCAGVVLGFRSKLEAARVQKDRVVRESRPGYQTRALVEANVSQIEQTIGAERYPHVSTGGSRGSVRLDRESMDAGRSEGQKVVLHRGIESSSGPSGRLLGR